MIDLKSETVIPARKVPDLMGPIGRNGSKIHISQVMRGILKGLNGHKLEAMRCGSHWVTSVEAVERWVTAQAESTGSPNQSLRPSPAARHRSAERASQELDAIGI